MQSNSLFILYTPFHQLIVEEILKRNEFNHRDIFIIDHNETISDNLTIYNYQFLGKNSYVKLLTLVKWRFFYKFYFKKFNIGYIFIPHLEGILSNFLFSKHVFEKKIEFSLYHEGVLSLYDYTRHNRNKTSGSKLLLSYLLLYKFKEFDNIAPFNSEHIKYVYLPQNIKTNLIDRTKIKYFSFSSFKINMLNPNNALLLGVSLNKYSKEEIKKLHQRVRKLLNENNISTLLIKPHPVQSKFPVEDFNDYFKCIVLDNNKAVEKLSKEIEFEIVISVNSSALLNIKWANPNVKAYSVNLRSHIHKNRRVILNNFKLNGIEIIEIV